jgi:hypothetical protein
MRAKKAFDCVEMKRGIQAEIHQEIKDLTRAEELEYWRKSVQAGPWGGWWREIYREAQARESRAERRPRKRARRGPTPRA